MLEFGKLPRDVFDLFVMISDFIFGRWVCSWSPWLWALLDLECTDLGSADTVDLVDSVDTVDIVDLEDSVDTADTVDLMGLVASAFKTEGPVRRLFGTSIRLNGSDCYLAGSEDC